MITTFIEYNKLIDNIPFITLNVLSLLVPILLIFISITFAPINIDNEKGSMYECGFEPFQDARLKFNIHFYIIAILFLIFDIEILYVYLWAMVLEQLDTIGFLSMILFLIFLTIGFFFEWYFGALDWKVDINIK